jgi:hypothetical protein
MSGSETERALRRALGWAPLLQPVDPSFGAALGVDIALDGRTAEGEAALAQALTLAMVTLRGSDVFNSGFGFRGLAAIAEETDPVLRRERIRLAVIEVLRDEPRVRKIFTVRFPDEDGNEAMAPRALPPPRSVAVEAAFDTVAGATQTLVLGGQALDVR